MKMVDLMKPIREELRNFEYSLQNDIDEFNSKLNLTKKDVSDYIDKQIDYLIKLKSEFNDQFKYLDEENRKTCEDNQQEFTKLCLSINQNDHNSIIVYKLFEQFKQKFPMRPKMIKSIPEYHFKDIQIDDFIIKQNCSPFPRIDDRLSSPLTDHNESSDCSFIPIDDKQIFSLPTSSIGSSYHKQLASQNCENGVEPESRLASTCTTLSEIDNMLEILIKIPYTNNRNPYLMCFNDEERYLLIYSLLSRQFEYFSLNSRQICPIKNSVNERILNLGYSRSCHLFYLSTREKNRFVLFRFNQQEKQIEIEQEVELIKEDEHFINVHIHQNFIYFLYLTSLSVVMLGAYHLESSSFLPPISFENKLYDHEERSPYRIIDFTISDSFICFLIQFRNKDTNKAKIVIYDYQTMDKLHSFHLIDAIKPISIVSTEKKSKSLTTSMCNDDIQLLLYINDPDARLIHCCNYQEYLIPAHVSNFGICSSDDGNLVLVARKDIRVLNVQDYIQRNREQSD